MWPGPDLQLFLGSSSHYLGQSLTIEDEACRLQLFMFKTVIEFPFQSDALQLQLPTNFVIRSMWGFFRLKLIVEMSS